MLIIEVNSVYSYINYNPKNKLSTLSIYIVIGQLWRFQTGSLILRSKYPYVQFQSWASASLTCSSNRLYPYMQHKSTMRNNLVSKECMKMVLNEICLMHDHALFTLALVKLLLDPLNRCTLLCSTMPIGHFLLKISHGLSSG